VQVRTDGRVLEPHNVIERLEALDLVEPTDDGWVLDRAVLAAAMALRT